MKYGKRTFQILGSISLVLLVNSIAQADSFSYISSLTGSPATANWATMSNPSASFVQSNTFASGSTTMSSDSNTITITDSDGQPMIFESEGSGWQSGGGTPNFSAGEMLIATNDPTTEQANGLTLTLAFASDIQEFGIQLQDYDYAVPYDAYISVNGGTTLNTNEFEEIGNGNVVFLGVEDTTGSGISSVTFSVPVAGSVGWFALGDAMIEGNATITSPPVTTPEPGSLMLMAGGIAALLLKFRKRARA